jgi:hypothetical protein
MKLTHGEGHKKYGQFHPKPLCTIKYVVSAHNNLVGDKMVPWRPPWDYFCESTASEVSEWET